MTWNGDGVTSGGTFGGTQVGYAYDALGRLVTRTTTSPSSTTREIYIGTDEAPVAETDSGSTITKFFVNTPYGPVETYNAAPSGTLKPSAIQFFNDHGDLAATATYAGVRTSLNSYGPFGEVTPVATGNTLVDRYTGAWEKKLDTTSGLILMGARPYDASLGRFVTVDPVDGGSANAYDYVNQDALNVFDLDGRCVWGLPCPWRGLGKEISRGVKKYIPIIDIPAKLHWAIDCGRQLGGWSGHYGGCDPVEFVLGPVENAYGNGTRTRRHRRH